MSEQLLEIQPSEILVDEKFNSRAKYERIDDLAKRIKAEGQTVPVIVSPTGNSKTPYRLVAGFRRYLAVSSLKGPKLKAIVRDIKTEKEAFLVNLSENIARDDLTPYEVAVSLVRLRDTYKMSATEIGAFLNVSKGFSKSNINHLISAVEKLHTKILQAWKDEHPACTMHNIIKWKSLTHDEQLEAFSGAAAVKADAGDDGEDIETGGGDSGEEKPKPAARINRAVIEEALAAAKGSDAKGAEYVIECLRFVLGKSTKLKAGDTVIYDPKQAAKEIEQAKEEEKRAKLEAKEKAKQAVEEAKAKAKKLVEDAKAKAQAQA